MLQLAIIRTVERNGKLLFSPLLESAVGDFEREIASRIRGILGPKKSYSGEEIDRAVAKAFESYKKDFKRESIKLK